MSEVFQIFRVSALTQAPGNEEFQMVYVNLFYQVIKFLQDNRLLLRPMANSV